MGPGTKALEDDRLRKILFEIAEATPTDKPIHTIYHHDVPNMIELVDRPGDIELLKVLSKKVIEAGEPIEVDFKDRLRRFIEARVAWHDLPRRD